MLFNVEIRFTCQIATSGYKFGEDGFVRPINPERGYIEKPLEEIAVFEFVELLSALDQNYKNGLPSEREQKAIIRFYNRWGFLEWYDSESEMAPWLLRALKENFETAGAAPKTIELHADNQDSAAVYGKIELMRHALWIAKIKADESKYTTCQFFKEFGYARQRRNGSCPPKCRVKINGPKSWGKGCQQVVNNWRERGKI